MPYRWEQTSLTMLSEVHGECKGPAAVQRHGSITDGQASIRQRGFEIWSMIIFSSSDGTRDRIFHPLSPVMKSIPLLYKLEGTKPVFRMPDRLTEHVVKPFKSAMLSMTGFMTRSLKTTGNSMSQRCVSFCLLKLPQLCIATRSVRERLALRHHTRCAARVRVVHALRHVAALCATTTRTTSRTTARKASALYATARACTLTWERHTRGDDSGQGAHGDIRAVHVVEFRALPRRSRARRWLRFAHPLAIRPRMGSRRNTAMDASLIAEKARQIVKDNGLEDTLTVVRGCVEDIKLPNRWRAWK